MLACEPYAPCAICSLAIWLNSTMSTRTAGIDTWLPATPRFARFGNSRRSANRENAGFSAAQVTARGESALTKRKWLTGLELGRKIGKKLPKVAVTTGGPSMGLGAEPAGKLAACPTAASLEFVAALLSRVKRCRASWQLALRCSPCSKPVVPIVNRCGYHRGCQRRKWFRSSELRPPLRCSLQPAEVGFTTGSRG